MQAAPMVAKTGCVARTLGPHLVSTCLEHHEQSYVAVVSATLASLLYLGCAAGLHLAMQCTCALPAGPGYGVKRSPGAARHGGGAAARHQLRTRAGQLCQGGCFARSSAAHQLVRPII